MIIVAAARGIAILQIWVPIYKITEKPFFPFFPPKPHKVTNRFLVGYGLWELRYSASLHYSITKLAQKILKKILVKKRKNGTGPI